MVYNNLRDLSTSRVLTIGVIHLITMSECYVLNKAFYSGNNWPKMSGLIVFFIRTTV